MGKHKGPTTTQTQSSVNSVDSASQKYIDQMRAQAGNLSSQIQHTSLFGGPLTQSVADQAGQFFNPYTQAVINPIQSQYNKLRESAVNGTADQAVGAGAFGSSREGAQAGARLAGLDQAQMQQIGQLMYGGWNNAVGQGTAYAKYQNQLAQQQAQEPLAKAQAIMQLYNLGLGPTGSTTTTRGNVTQPGGSPIGSAAGGALAGFDVAGPWGAAVGGLGGLLGGMF